jgi:hypothetical protein
VVLFAQKKKKKDLDDKNSFCEKTKRHRVNYYTQFFSSDTKNVTEKYRNTKGKQSPKLEMEDG